MLPALYIEALWILWLLAVRAEPTVCE